MTTPTRENRPDAPGPDASLAQVLSSFEAAGHADPALAWQNFTGTFNWAARLATAVPCRAVPAPVAREESGGFTVSGMWGRPSHAGRGPWLALPLAAGANGGPDLFVVHSKVLDRTEPGLAGGVAGAVFRLDSTHVPAGFATRTAAVPLLAEDAPFLWTATAALALGAARRTADVLAATVGYGAVPAPGGPTASAVVAAESAAVLHGARMDLASVLHGVPTARQGLSAAAGKRLFECVGRAANAAHHVVASVYGQALTSPGANRDRQALADLIEASAPILQQVRYSRDLLPPRRRQPGHEEVAR
ncbi:hypothetical protein [Streptomyces sp. NPDC060184]|uniref:hypothetical protein n=1 Tax=Streptomyces sp. NPDC060184 TaxID=3347064 RepID=UPI0036637BD8